MISESLFNLTPIFNFSLLILQTKHIFLVSLFMLTTFMFLEKQKKLVDLNCKLMIKQRR